MHTKGKGSPFLSKEVSQFLVAVRRRELRSLTFQKHVSHPVLSSDFCKFEVTVSAFISCALEDFITKWNEAEILARDDAQGEEDSEWWGLKATAAVEELITSTAWPCLVQTLPQLTRASCHRGEAYSIQHQELSAHDYGIRDEPIVSKHAQEGTTSADHNRLIHSGFGPFCCRTALQLDVYHSLDYYTKFMKLEAKHWFMGRLQCLTAHAKNNENALSEGFCVCCSLTMCDAILNAQYNAPQWAMLWAATGAAASQEETQQTVDEFMCSLFKPRPTTGFYFPALKFGRRCKNKYFNTPAGVASGVLLSFEEAMVPREDSSQKVTWCVQAMGASNWPDGYRITTYGTCPFTPAQQQSHDIKRGTLIELAYGGETIT